VKINIMDKFKNDKKLKHNGSKCSNYKIYLFPDRVVSCQQMILFIYLKQTNQFKN